MASASPNSELDDESKTLMDHLHERNFSGADPIDVMYPMLRNSMPSAQFKAMLLGLAPVYLLRSMWQAHLNNAKPFAHQAVKDIISKLEIEDTSTSVLDAALFAANFGAHGDGGLDDVPACIHDSNPGAAWALSVLGLGNLKFKDVKTVPMYDLCFEKSGKGLLAETYRLMVYAKSQADAFSTETDLSAAKYKRLASETMLHVMPAMFNLMTDELTDECKSKERFMYATRRSESLMSDWLLSFHGLQDRFTRKTTLKTVLKHMSKALNTNKEFSSNMSKLDDNKSIGIELRSSGYSASDLLGFDLPPEVPEAHLEPNAYRLVLACTTGHVLGGKTKQKKGEVTLQQLVLQRYVAPEDDLQTSYPTSRLPVSMWRDEHALVQGHASPLSLLCLPLDNPAKVYHNKFCKNIDQVNGFGAVIAYRMAGGMDIIQQLETFAIFIKKRGPSHLLITENLNGISNNEVNILNATVFGDSTERRLQGAASYLKAYIDLHEKQLVHLDAARRNAAVHVNRDHSLGGVILFDLDTMHSANTPKRPRVKLPKDSLRIPDIVRPIDDVHRVIKNCLCLLFEDLSDDKDFVYADKNAQTSKVLCYFGDKPQPWHEVLEELGIDRHIYVGLTSLCEDPHEILSEIRFRITQRLKDHETKGLPLPKLPIQSLNKMVQDAIVVTSPSTTKLETVEARPFKLSGNQLRQLAKENRAVYNGNDAEINAWMEHRIETKVILKSRVKVAFDHPTGLPRIAAADNPEKFTDTDLIAEFDNTSVLTMSKEDINGQLGRNERRRGMLILRRQDANVGSINAIAEADVDAGGVQLSDREHTTQVEAMVTAQDDGKLMTRDMSITEKPSLAASARGVGSVVISMQGMTLETPSSDAQIAGLSVLKKFSTDAKSPSALTQDVHTVVNDKTDTEKEISMTVSQAAGAIVTIEPDSEVATSTSNPVSDALSLKNSKFVTSPIKHQAVDLAAPGRIETQATTTSSLDLPAGTVLASKTVSKSVTVAAGVLEADVQGINRSNPEPTSELGRGDELSKLTTSLPSLQEETLQRSLPPKASEPRGFLATSTTTNTLQKLGHVAARNSPPQDNLSPS